MIEIFSACRRMMTGKDQVSQMSCQAVDRAGKEVLFEEIPTPLAAKDSIRYRVVSFTVLNNL